MKRKVIIVGIYKFTNKISGKSYIGQSINVKQRYTNHIWSSKLDTPQQKFDYAIKKYGIDKFNFEVIEELETSERLNEREIYWIKFYDTFKGCGYNMNAGGKSFSGTDHHMADMKPYTFYHNDGRVEKDIIQIDFCNKYNNVSNVGVSKLINGERRKHKGWRIHKVLPKTIKSPNGSVMTIYNEELNLYATGSLTELSKKYNLHKGTLSSVRTKKVNSVNGWTLV